MGAPEISAVLVALLLTKHFVCDFLLQNRYQIKGKGIYGSPGGLLHAGIHVIGTAAVMLPFPVSWGFLGLVLLLEFVVHYHLDWGKQQLTRRLRDSGGQPFWNLFGLDQLLHQLTYVAIAVWAGYAHG